MATTAIKINRGTSWSTTYTHQHDGVPVDITGATVYFTVKSQEYDSTQDDSTSIIEETVTSHVDPTNGVTNIELSPEQTSYIQEVAGNYIVPGQYTYDIKVKEADGSVYKTVEGKCTIDGSPTNRSVA